MGEDRRKKRERVQECKCGYERMSECDYECEFKCEGRQERMSECCSKCECEYERQGGQERMSECYNECKSVCMSGGRSEEKCKGQE